MYGFESTMYQNSQEVKVQFLPLLLETITSVYIFIHKYSHTDALGMNI